MHRLLAFAMLALAGCVSPHVAFPLPAEQDALRLGPQPGTEMRPRIFLADRVEESMLAELAPFAGKRFSFSSALNEAACAQRATPMLVEGRPDAILVAPGSPQVIGVNTAFFANPWAPMNVISVSTANVGTSAVGYAMRAMPVSLPFRYSPTSGVVLDVVDRDAVTGGLLEGDVLTAIDLAPAIPPKDWPTWVFYSQMLRRSPGDVIELAWVRAGSGKMAGTVRLAPPQRPHLRVTDSVDTTYMPRIDVRVGDRGRETWQMSSAPWEPPQQWEFSGPPRRRS